MRILSKTELKRRLKDVRRKGLTDRQLQDLIDSLWRDRMVEKNHMETGSLQVESPEPAFQYARPFQGMDYYLSVQAFRLVTLPGAGVVRREIPYHSLVQGQEGFSLVLADHEPGDQIRYYACEQT